MVEKVKRFFLKKKKKGIRKTKVGRVTMLNVQYIPVRPDLHVFFRGLKDQIHKSFTRSICWKWRRVVVNGPEPVSSKSMLLKCTMASELQSESKFLWPCDLESNDNINAISVRVKGDSVIVIIFKKQIQDFQFAIILL